MSETKDVRLLPCPFCGDEASIERRGTARQSNIVTCDHCGARVESGDTFDPTLSWNCRAALEPAPKPAGGEWVTDDLVERVAIERHHRYDDEDTVKWGKQPSRYRTSARKTAREVLTSLAAVRPAAPPASAASPSGEEVEALRRAVWRLSGSGMSFRRFWIAYANKLDTLTKTNVQRGERALTSPEAPQASEVVREVVKFLGWVAKSYEAHAKCTDDPEELDAYHGSAEMARQHAAALAKIGGDHDK